MNVYNKSKNRWVDDLVRENENVSGQDKDFIERMYDIHNIHSRKANVMVDGQVKKEFVIYEKEVEFEEGLTLNDFYATMGPWMTKFTALKDAANL